MFFESSVEFTFRRVQSLSQTCDAVGVRKVPFHQGDRLFNPPVPAGCKIPKRPLRHVMRRSLAINQQGCQGFDGASLAAMIFDQVKGEINRRGATGASNYPVVIEIDQI